MHRGSDSTIDFSKKSKKITSSRPQAFFLGLAVLAAPLAAVLLSCAPGKGDQVAVLKVWDFKYGENDMGEVMRAVDREFERENPSVKIEHRALSDVDDDAVLTAAIAANAPPDVAMVHAGAELRAFADKFAPADGAAAELGITAAALDACRDGSGTLRAIPLTTQGFGWYYNKKIFAAAGLDPEIPPRKWDAFLSACAALKKAGVRPIAWGNNPPHGSDWLRRTLAATFYSPAEIENLFAGAAFARDGRFAEISSIIRQLRDSGYLDTPGAFRDHIGDAASDFREGRAAMFLGLYSDIDNWKEFSDALGKDAVGFFASIDHPDAAFPETACVQGAGIAYAVLADSPRKDIAFRYAAFYLKDPAARLLTEKVGALLPLERERYPAAEYPALRAVLRARDSGTDDPELHYPSLAIKQNLFRYDELFFNTREISLATYLAALTAAAEGGKK